jgi:nickel superoxide dismutase
MTAKKKLTTVFVMVVAVLAGGVMMKAYSHCQIPCGIYDDPARLKLMDEHITTLEKSIGQMTELSGADRTPANTNQLVRWIDNKDRHADELAEIITYYFMAQRIKSTEPGSPNYDKYLRELTLLHEMLVTSMQCKQTVDSANIAKLRTLLKDFAVSYTNPQPAAEAHSH